MINKQIVIKKADKGSCVVVWDRDDYLLEAERQSKDEKIDRSVTFNEKLIEDLTECNKMFKDLTRGGYLSEKQLNYYSFKYKKVCNLGKLYLLPKIHKSLYNVPGRPVISNCGTPTEKASEFLDNHLKSIMQNSWSYIRDSGDFIDEIKRIKNIPKDAILVTADLIGLYPCILHVAGLKALKNALDARENKSIPTENLLNIAESVLKNDVFEFNGTVKEQISGTAIGAKCAPSCACIFMSEFETRFIESQQNKPLVWCRYIDDIFFIWTHGEDKLKTFLEHLNILILVWNLPMNQVK